MTTLVLLMALVAAPTQRDCAPQLAPLDTGTHSGASNVSFWRKHEAGAWGGEGWLGWTHDGNTLQPVRLIVRDRPKDRADDDDEVFVESIPTVTFAVRCIPNLRAGKIRTTNIFNQESLQPNLPLKVSLGSSRY